MNAARTKLDLAAAGSSQGYSAKHGVLNQIIRQGFVPIFVNDALDSRRLVEAAVSAGCRTLEYTCRRPDAREMIPWIKREFPGVAVLAATLVDADRIAAQLSRNLSGFLTVDEAVDLGADGLVSFLRFQPKTYARYGATHVMIAGVGSPNEAIDQLELGADLIKVTVGSTSGSELVAKSRVPAHGCIPYFISGGLTLDNIENFIKAGVVATAAGFDILAGTGATDLAHAPGVARSAIERMIAAVGAAREKHQPGLVEAIQNRSTNLLSAGPWFHSASAF